MSCSEFSLHYHLIFVVKYRRKVIDDTISMRLKEIFEYIQPSYNITLQEWNHDKDHVHILFSAHPKTEFPITRRQGRCCKLPRRSTRTSFRGCGKWIRWPCAMPNSRCRLPTRTFSRTISEVREAVDYDRQVVSVLQAVPLLWVCEL